MEFSIGIQEVNFSKNYELTFLVDNEISAIKTPLTKKGIIKLKNDIVKFINENNGDDITLINVTNNSDTSNISIYVDMYCGDNDFDPTTCTFNFEDYPNKTKK